MQSSTIISFLIVIHNGGVQQPVTGGQDFRLPKTLCYWVLLFSGIGVVIHLFRNYPTTTNASVGYRLTHLFRSFVSRNEGSYMIKTYWEILLKSAGKMKTLSLT